MLIKKVTERERGSIEKLSGKTHELKTVWYFIGIPFRKDITKTVDAKS